MFEVQNEEKKKQLFWEMGGSSNFMVDKSVNRVRIYII